MTGVLPHQSLRGSLAICSALGQNAVPAQVDDLDTPEFIKQLLGKTWSILSVASRPPMRRCVQILAQRRMPVPVITPGILTVSSDWGTLKLLSSSATICADIYTKDERYSNVIWTKKSMRINSPSHKVVSLP